MTILALVTGAVFRLPEQRTAKTGRPFVSATLRIKDGTESQFIRVTAFSESAQAELLCLAEGDAVSVQGQFNASVYTSTDGNAKVGLSIVANCVLALRQPPKSKAKAAGLPIPETRSRQDRCAGTWTAESCDPNDDIGFGGER